MSNCEGLPASVEGCAPIVGTHTHVVGDRVVMAIRRGVVPSSALDAAWSAFVDLDERLPPSLSRRAAAGAPCLERMREWFPRAVALQPVSPTSARVVRDDGHVMPQVVSNPVRSYIGGWRWDRFKAAAAPGIVTRRLPERWAAAAPFFSAVDTAYREHFPLEHAKQSAAVRHRIGSTCFTTAAINIDYASHYHRDVGDFPGGLSTVAPCGDFEGGLLVFPTLRLYVDLRPGDVAFFHAHELLHGNTPVTSGRRLSIVAYARKQLCREVAS